MDGQPVLSWWKPVTADRARGYVAYRGWLSGAGGLRLRCGFDGWSEPVQELPFEPVGDGVSVAVVPDLAGHLTLDMAVTDGERWDDNYGVDYRLWIGLDPVDAHVHASAVGMGERQSDSLHVALRSAGVRTAVVSWRDNRFVDWLLSTSPHLRGLVWVRPRHTRLEAVRRRLASGHVGLKLHPAFDRYRADHRSLDPYLEVAAEAGRPVTVHSGPGPSDPDLIRKLAERFPTVPIVLYHTYLGPPEGRRRAAAHAGELDNLHLETSWCGTEEVCRLVEEVGADRVLFGSDAAVDGHTHYVREPPNVEGRETYNSSLVELARALGPDVTRQVFSDNARALFALAPA